MRSSWWCGGWSPGGASGRWWVEGVFPPRLARSRCNKEHRLQRRQEGGRQAWQAGRQAGIAGMAWQARQAGCCCRRRRWSHYHAFSRHYNYTCDGGCLGGPFAPLHVSLFPFFFTSTCYFPPPVLHSFVFPPLTFPPEHLHEGGRDGWREASTEEPPSFVHSSRSTKVSPKSTKQTVPNRCTTSGEGETHSRLVAKNVFIYKFLQTIYKL